METEAIYFPYYRNHWALIEFKPPEVRLIWFETMSRMAFGEFPKPEKPIEGLSSAKDIAVWEAYNTFYPIISKFKKTDKRFSEEFRQKGRENGLRGGRPRKDGGSSGASDDFQQPNSDEFATHHEDLKDPVLDISLTTDDCNLTPKEKFVKKNAIEWKRKCPDAKTFANYVRNTYGATVSASIISDTEFLFWAYDELCNDQFAQRTNGNPISNMSHIIAKLHESYVKKRKRENEDQEKASAAERNFSVNVDQRQQAADIALLREREEMARRFREEKNREKEIEDARKAAQGKEPAVVTTGEGKPTP